MKKDSYFYRTYFNLFGVVALQNLIVFSVNLADSIMLGTYSELAMSGVSLANQVQFLLQMFIGGTANGLVVIASQYWGKKELLPIKKVFAAAFTIAVFMSFLLGLLVYLHPEAVLRILSDQSAIIAEGATYLRIMALSYVFFAISNMFIALMRSVESVKIGFASSLIALFVNVFLNYGLIFGKMGMPEMGVKGAAYATFASRFIELCAVSIYVFFIDKKVVLHFADVLKVEKDYLRDFIKAGLPLVGAGGSWGVAMTVQTAILGRLGVAAIGANAVSAPVFQVVSVLYASSSSASAVLIGKTVGENNIQRVKSYARRLQVIFLITGLISSALLILTKNTILKIYDLSDETSVLAGMFINVLAVTVIGSAYEAPALGGIVSGGGDTKFVFFNDLLFMWAIVLPLSALSAFVFKWPPVVTFFILKSDQLTKCIVAAVKVNRFKWIKNLTR